MNLTLIRTTLTDVSTEGILLVNDQKEFVTLELPVKDGLPGSAIPEGKYLVQLLPSPKFEASSDPWVQRYAGAIPHLLGIPNRSDILIHWGNAPHDTNGCVLVGMEPGENFIGRSREAFETLWTYLDAARARGEANSITVQRQMLVTDPDIAT